ncbi:replicative DNA helicase [Aquabacterium commune]|uniref:Replicative DNA helicase n=1 Tax=Aquabacterium commune TaxID=70586 RepID=A0A4R6QZD0_9BURK|nr:replicative DNA helicase [Aquabacterium commune]TDP78659.1 replicative DNA helicase [Aquabacterium commune]
MKAVPQRHIEQDDAQLSALRVPPHSIEAEQSVLGGLLLDNTAWDHAADLLLEHDFYRHEHRLIYGALAELINATKPADVITVYERLKSSGTGDECGGLGYLNSLAQSVPSAANIRRYAEIVRERSVLRKMIAVSDEAIASALQPDGRSVTQILDEFESKALKIAEQGSRHAKIWSPLDSLIAEAIDGIMANADKGGVALTGLSTGLADLDKQTSGLQDGDLIVLAARPSMGKTALALNIGEHVAVNLGLPVAVFSMEMGGGQLALRMIGSSARIDQSNLRAGTLSDDEWSRLSETTERLIKAQMFIDETGALSANELRARARRKARECGGKLGLIIVDYLQLMAGGEAASGGAAQENRATMLGEVSRGLKALAKELQCPVIALSQLNRAVESRPDKRPMMSDLRESGAIEQDADVIMFIYRDDYYNKESSEPGVAEIILAKQRNGPVGTVKLGFLKPQTKFVNLQTI